MENQTNGQKESATCFDKQDLCLLLVFQNMCSKVTMLLHLLLKLNLAKRYIKNRQQHKQRLQHI